MRASPAFSRITNAQQPALYGTRQNCHTPSKWDRTMPASLTSLYRPSSGPWRTRAAGHRGRRELPGAGPIVYLSIRRWDDAECGMRVQRLLQDSGDVGWVCSKLCATLLRPSRGCLFLSGLSGLDVALAALGRGGQPLTTRHRDGVTLCYVSPFRGDTGSRAGSSQIALRGPEVTRKRPVP